MPPTPEEVVAANVRLLRVARELSQDGLAELLVKAGHRQSAMSIWGLENNRRRINVADLVAIADVLDVTPQQLMSSDPDALDPADPVTTYAVTVEGGETEVVEADRTELDDGWLNFHLRGERVFFAPAARVLCIRVAAHVTANGQEAHRSAGATSEAQMEREIAGRIAITDAACGEEESDA
jgi:transcriptional regulator with XRE-family HTH domain